MAKIDCLKVNNTLRFIQNVAYLTELPVATENSADLVSVANTLYVKKVENGTYSYTTIGGGGVALIEKTIDTESEPLAFTEDFTQEEFDELLSGALLQVWTMPNILSYVLKPYLIQTQASANAYGVRLSALTDIETGNYLCIDVLQSNGIFQTRINNVATASGGATIIEKETTANAETGMPNFDTLTFTSEELTKMQDDNVVLKIVVPDASSVMFLNKIQNYGAAPTFYYTFGLVVGAQEIMLMVIDNNGSSMVMPNITNLGGGSGSGTTIIDITGLDIIPSEYQDAELLKTAILFDTDHLLRLTWIDDMYYYGNTDDFQYRYLSVDTSDYVIMRYNLQEIAKAPKVVNLNTYVPSTATNGTLESSVLSVLQASDSNYIVFNNEIFKLADKQHNEGYLVYSHNGHDTTGCFFQKCITITLSTRGWVLEEQENASKTYVDNAIGGALQGDY